MASKTIRYSYLLTGGRVSGGSGGTPDNDDLTEHGASTYRTYTVGIDDKFSKGDSKRARGSVMEALGPYPYGTEYILYAEGGCGDFVLGTTCQQQVGGETLNAIVTLWEHTTSHNFNIWPGNTNGYILGIANVGPTGGTGLNGPTGPGHSGGYTANSAGTGGKVFHGTTHGWSGGGCSWDVRDINRIINPDDYRTVCTDFEIDAITQGIDYTALLYNESGNTLDLTNTITHMEELKHKIYNNHTIYGTANANFSISGCVIMDSNGDSFTINAISGGTPDNGNVSQFTTLYYHWSIADDAFDVIRDGILSDYTAGTGGSQGALDSVHKLRTLYDSRN